MIIQNKDMPAMPCFNDSGAPIHYSAAGIHCGCIAGLTKRETSVLMFIQGLLANPALDLTAHEAVMVAISHSDAAFEAMEKTK